MSGRYMPREIGVLALFGGRPIRVKKWKDNITTGTRERRAVKRVLKTGYLSLYEGSHEPDPPFSFVGGPEVRSLESEWSEAYGSKHAVAVNSATSGLFAAMGALGVGFGDEVIVSPYTMTACAMAPLLYGAIPVFADVEQDTGCLDPNDVLRKITSRTKAIIVVHQFGFPANMTEIMRIAEERGIKVVEDCAQAHGAKHEGKSVGTWGDIGVFSLNVNKTIQSGEGGVCITGDDDLAYRLQLIRNHGEAVVGAAGYTNILNIFGFNYRMTEVTAAIAREQLKKLRILNSRRLKLVEVIASGLKDDQIIKPMGEKFFPGGKGCRSGCSCIATFYVLPFLFQTSKSSATRAEFSEAATAEGVTFFQGYVRPLYLNPVFQTRNLFKYGYPFTAPPNQSSQLRYEKGTCPVAERLHFEEVLVNEFIRWPHSERDMNDILAVVDKISSSWKVG